MPATKSAKPAKQTRDAWLIDGAKALEAQRIVAWYLMKEGNHRLLTWVMAHGSMADFQQEVVIALIRNPPPKTVRFTTAVCRAVRWRLSGFKKSARSLPQGDPPERGELIDVSAAIQYEELCHDMDRCMVENLEQRAVEVLRMRLARYTLEEVGCAHRVSPERIRQIEKKSWSILGMNGGLLAGHLD